MSLPKKKLKLIPYRVSLKSSGGWELLQNSQGKSPAPGLLKCGNFTLNLAERTHLMGILNVTPDSFSDGGKFLDPAQAVAHALEMVRDGADIIDVGAESSRPGADAVSVEDELNRLLPVLKILIKEVPVPISVDTTKYEVAQASLDLGIQIINDISGLSSNEEMASLLARYDAAIVIMHMRGNPRNMQSETHYDNLIGEIFTYLEERAAFAVGRGISRDRIVIDPGIGFGKTVKHNLLIIKHLAEFKKSGLPLLLGTSRKSFIGKILDLPTDEREEGTAATVTYGITQGANIVRVHDVAGMKRVVRMTDAILGAD